MKPIFDRDEIKRPECSTSTEEVEEHRTVKTIDTERTGMCSNNLFMAL